MKPSILKDFMRKTPKTGLSISVSIPSVKMETPKIEKPISMGKPDDVMKQQDDDKFNVIRRYMKGA